MTNNKIYWLAPLIAGIIKIIYVLVAFGFSLSTLAFVFVDAYASTFLAVVIFNQLNKLGGQKNEK